MKSYTAENQMKNCSPFLVSIAIEETPNLIKDFSFLLQKLVPGHKYANIKTCCLSSEFSSTFKNSGKKKTKLVHTGKHPLSKVILS